MRLYGLHVAIMGFASNYFNSRALGSALLAYVAVSVERSRGATPRTCGRSSPRHEHFVPAPLVGPRLDRHGLADARGSHRRRFGV